MTYAEALSFGEELLQQSSIQESKLDAWLLLEYVTQLSRAEYFLKKEEIISTEHWERYKQYLGQRGKHIPLQQITGSQEFMGLPFVVNKDVLIPRQDTECLVEYVLPFAKGKRVLDVCTGSGCIAISIDKLGDCQVCHGVDLSAKALAVAEQNKEVLESKVVFWQSDLFSQVSEKYDIILSNPPYIPPKVIEGLMPEVRDYEPRMALDGGEDGLDFYRVIAKQARQYLCENALIAFEIGCEQGEDVSCILQENGYSQVEVHQDLAGLDRIVVARWQ